MELRHEPRRHYRIRRYAPERIAARYVQTSDGITRIKHGGNGLPTVVFVGGIGEGLNAWSNVLADVAEVTHAISYDRLGLGYSAPAATERDCVHIASELRNLLSAVHEASAPVVVVAHSAGAFHARMFAHRHPERVAGLVFVEPSDEEWLPALKESDPKGWLRHMQWRNSPKHPPGRRHELAAWDRMMEQMRVIGRGLPEVPVTIISATGGTAASGDVLFGLHQRWAATLPGARHVVTDAGGHHIQKDAPQVIVDEVEEMVSRIQFDR